MAMDVAKLTPQQIYRKQEAGDPVVPGDAPDVRRHIITVLLENHAGALNRVINMFSQRGFNLESVTVGQTDDPSISRLTLVTTGNNRVIKQVNRQLNNLIDALEVDDLTTAEYVERELCLLRVNYTAETRPQLINTNDIFEGNVVDITHDTMTFQIVGPTKKINAFVALMQPHGIQEVARSGRLAMRRALIHGD